MSSPSSASSWSSISERVLAPGARVAGASAAQVAAMEAQNETVNDSVTQMVDDPNVLKSEIDDIRKSVVSMSVGQPGRTSTIVKEWLEQPAPEAPAQAEEAPPEETGESEEESSE